MGLALKRLSLKLLLTYPGSLKMEAFVWENSLRFWSHFCKTWNDELVESNKCGMKMFNMILAIHN